MGVHETLKLCATKEIINRVKKQPTKGEKIFANCISDRGEYPEYIKTPTTQQ